MTSVFAPTMLFNFIKKLLAINYKNLKLISLFSQKSDKENLPQKILLLNIQTFFALKAKCGKNRLRCHFPHCEMEIKIEF
jgi:hypothetical protein